MAIERAGIDKRSESIFEVKNKFSKLNADDQVFANLRFCIQTLYKYYLEPFYEATLDNTDTLKMNANMGQYPFSKGGVDLEFVPLSYRRFEEIETDDPVGWLRDFVKGKDVTLTVDEKESGDLTVFVESGGVTQKFLFTRL